MKARLSTWMALGTLCVASPLAFSQPNTDPMETLVREVEHTLFWEQMPAQDRAELWPILSHEQRMMHWRMMTREERLELTSHMTALELPSFRLRFLAPMRLLNLQPKETRPLTPEERETLRAQVRAVRHEMLHGVPYDCTDPRNCPKVIRVETTP